MFFQINTTNFQEIFLAIFKEICANKTFNKNIKKIKKKLKKFCTLQLLTPISQKYFEF